MRVTLFVVGGDTHEFTVTTAADTEPGPPTTYADLLADVGLSPHEVAVMVDGSPVPEDHPVDADFVRVLRLIQGG
ncbi:ubiquitin-like small modifier protein SAMP2 [Halobacterium salinarum]|uniref:Sulfur carrier protein n=1 Tax=Halobacterium salinarum (strain ATCC 33171 / DSM 3754 / JCM 8978 / NBRC 102687 / NCIMB 764 / 91-R6) TaxID=2597657 RepID=A0A4D6GZH6_HALS9|nr:ubiquitin-like small modifier protein 2 [Halobacterium salinarum]MDL0125825.1 MoaD/ThiS family protein [Halobacterium salinarum]MDL0137016.1 MoaD/ThiS family protein [Halobacterium salinarum]MDL0144552.1 MoaD/ThiS family protein [Halobacterium salinarum]QCC45887.1 ubiquitin-like modifier protein SAMP2 [Halobacterium salinarum]TYO82145.1 sulfur carrier protein [Halobacterium salinarum DSM 3754]